MLALQSRGPRYFVLFDFYILYIDFYIDFIWSDARAVEVRATAAENVKASTGLNTSKFATNKQRLREDSTLHLVGQLTNVKKNELMWSTGVSTSKSATNNDHVKKKI